MGIVILEVATQMNTKIKWNRYPRDITPVKMTLPIWIFTASLADILEGSMEGTM